MKGLKLTRVFFEKERPVTLCGRTCTGWSEGDLKTRGVEVTEMDSVIAFKDPMTKLTTLYPINLCVRVYAPAGEAKAKK